VKKKSDEPVDSPAERRISADESILNDLYLLKKNFTARPLSQDAKRLLFGSGDLI
jgi:hypothetical protein